MTMREERRREAERNGFAHTLVLLNLVLIFLMCQFITDWSNAPKVFAFWVALELFSVLLYAWKAAE